MAFIIDVKCFQILVNQINQFIYKQSQSIKKQEQQLFQKQNEQQDLIIQQQTKSIFELKQQVAIYQQRQEIKQYPSFKYGFRNLGNTCYINSALQLIKHMQSIDSSFLNQKRSKFSLKLKNFFENQDRSSNSDQQLQEIVSVSKRNQQHESGGGDSYITAINYLKIIIDEVSNGNCSEELSDFQKYFTLQFQDGAQCSQCLKFNQDDNEPFFYFKENDSSLDIISHQDLLNFPSVYGENKINQRCSYCKKNCLFQTKRNLLFYPKFMIVKFPKNQKIRGKPIDVNNPIQFNDNKGEKQSYQTIGYCTYTGFHYTYTGNYSGEGWYIFNDSSVSKQANINIQQAIYLLLYKQNSS